MHPFKNIDLSQLSQRFNTYSDDRGNLTVADFSQIKLPFTPQRVFWIYGIPPQAERGGHANRKCCELVIALKGSFRLWLSDGENHAEYTLNHPQDGVYIPPMVWCELTDFSPESICLCIADQPYNTSDYINEYHDFIKERRDEVTAI